MACGLAALEIIDQENLIDNAAKMGALLSGVVADLFGMRAAIHLVAALTLGSGLVVATVMRETRNEP